MRKLLSALYAGLLLAACAGTTPPADALQPIYGGFITAKAASTVIVEGSTALVSACVLNSASQAANQLDSAFSTAESAFAQGVALLAAASAASGPAQTSAIASATNYLSTGQAAMGQAQTILATNVSPAGAAKAKAHMNKSASLRPKFVFTVPVIIALVEQLLPVIQQIPQLYDLFKGFIDKLNSSPGAPVYAYADVTAADTTLVNAINNWKTARASPCQ